MCSLLQYNNRTSNRDGENGGGGGGGGAAHDSELVSPQVASGRTVGKALSQ